MKKIFTLIAMVFVTMGVNAQDLPEHVYPIKSITWKNITWKNGNNKEDKDKQPMYFLMGTGNGYENIYAEEIVTEGEETGRFRGYYTYIDYEAGKTGIPGYGLYYKFTPSTSGTLKINVWVNKGNRKTFVVKASNGTPLVPNTDYFFDGYVNGQNANTDQPKIDEATGEQALDNEGNPVWIQAPKYFTADEIKARHEARNEEIKTKNEEKIAKGENPDALLSDYVIDAGNQAIWGWITFNVEAGESYVLYQQSSQIGFGGFEFGGEKYVASPEKGLAAEFAAVVDADGNATNVTDKGSVVSFTAAGVAVEAVGGAEPDEVVGDKPETGINAIKTTQTSNAAMYNLAGQKVSDSFKGIVIQNGRKMIQK